MVLTRATGALLLCGVTFTLHRVALPQYSQDPQPITVSSLGLEGKQQSFPHKRLALLLKKTTVL